MKAPLVIAIALNSCLLSAQIPLRIEPVFRNYNTDQGLPNNWVYDIIQDSKGYIWISTNHGVCRFNGYEFERFSDTLYSNYTSVLGRCMVEDEVGRIWFVDMRHRVFYIENGRIVSWKHNNRLAQFSKDVSLYVGLLVKGRGEEIWLGGPASGITHVNQDGQCERLFRPDSADRVFFENERGWLDTDAPAILDKILVNKTEKVSYGGKIIPLPVSAPAQNLGADRNFLLFSSNRLSTGEWIYNRFGKYYCLKNGRLLWHRKAPGAATIRVFQDADGRIFTGHHYGEGFKVYHSMEDFRANKPALSLLKGLTVSAFLQDREGGYWIGTQERGLFYCPSFENGRLAGLPGMEDAVVKSVVWDSKSTLYAGFFNGKVYAIDLKTLTARDISSPAVRLIQDLYYDAPSQTLALSGNSSMFYQNGAWNCKTIFDPVIGKTRFWTSLKITPTKDSERWLSASGMGLSLVNIRAKKLERCTEYTWTGKNTGRFSAIRMDQTGRIWAAGQNGLMEWVGDRIIPTDTAYPALRQRIRDMVLLPDTSFILCPKGHGLVFWKPGHPPMEINSQKGLLSNLISSLHYNAPDSSIWACTELGLNKLSPNGNGAYQIEAFTVKHGLPSNLVNDVCVVNNDVWLATDKGLYCVYDQLKASSIPGPEITSLNVDNTLYYPNGSIDLPHDSSDISIEFLSLHFRSNGQIPYAYRLIGDAGDTAWSYGPDRRVSLLNLNPGNYQFEVKAQDDANKWSPVSTLGIIIRPPWHATWWARGLGLTSLAGLAFAVYRYRMNRMRNEAQLAAEMHRLERSALQAQMNPHFIFNCLSSIQHFILNNEPDAAVIYLAKFAKLVRSTLEASVLGEVSLGEEVRMLDYYLSLEQMRFQDRFDYQIEVDEQLDREHTVLPPIIVQPFVENAVLHGMKNIQKEGHISVTFQKVAENLSILVCDNGQGMDAQSVTHEGLSLGRGITHQRLGVLQQQNIQKTVALRYLVPENGTGTCVSITIPLLCKANVTKP